MRQDRNDVDAKFTALRHQTNSYLNEIKKLIHERIIPEELSIISYFTYSLNISHDPEHESLCLGSFHIRNMGNQAILNPYVCIKIPTDSPFSFSGKYVYPNFKQSFKGEGGWERINEKENKEEFWLKPLGKPSIEPHETISFSNFQIRWSPKESYAISITAFAYCDQLKDGIAVMNPINLTGTIGKQEDEDVLFR